MNISESDKNLTLYISLKGKVMVTTKKRKRPTKKHSLKLSVQTITVDVAEKWLAVNTCNRPFRKTLAKRYAQKMIDGNWRLNGEPIILDSQGRLVSGQHRLNALLIASEKKEGVTFDSVVVAGVMPSTADSVDLGQKRTHGDILFRRHEFKGKDYSDAQKKQMSNILARACRFVWIREQGKTYSDGLKFDEDSMTDFLKSHEGLKAVVLDVIELDKDNNRSITARLPLHHAVANVWLSSDGKYNDSYDGPAYDFLVGFATGEAIKKGDPIFELREAYVRDKQREKTRDRDNICQRWAKAWNLWNDGKKKITANQLNVKKGENPRFGEIDAVQEEDIVEVEEGE